MPKLFLLGLSLVWFCLVQDVRWRGRAVWWCKLYLLLQWDGLYQHLKALEEIVNNGWAVDRDSEEDLGHTGWALKDRFTALILTHHMHLLKQEEKKGNGSWAHARLCVKTLNKTTTPGKQQNRATILYANIFVSLILSIFLARACFQSSTPGARCERMSLTL